MSEKIQNLMLILEDIAHVPTRSRTMSERASNPLEALVYREITQLDPKEIDGFKNKYGRPDVIFSKVFSLKNPYLFSGFLSIGAFKPYLSPESIWILEQIKKPSLDLYEAIYQHEKNEGIYASDPKPHEKINFIPHMMTYLDAMDTPEKKKVAKLIYEKYEDYPQGLLKNSFDNIKRHASIFMIEKFKQTIDINENGFMEEYLQTNREKEFFISSTHFDSLRKLLSIGFKFNEEKYSKHGETLMTAVLSAGRAETVSIILPYLEQIKPINITIEEQAKLLELYKDTNFYDEIKGHYYKKLYEHMLEEKTTHDAPKIKI